MKPLMAIGGIGAVCALCCAGPLILAGGALTTAHTVASFAWGWPLLALAIALLCLLVVPGAKRTAAPACRQSCACNNDASPIIACSLAKHDYDARISEFRALASRALRDVRREPLSLHLTYDPAFADQVRNLAERERDCCSFLAITVDEDCRGIHLHITAPEEARLAANELFRDFTSAILQPA